MNDPERFSAAGRMDGLGATASDEGAKVSDMGIRSLDERDIDDALRLTRAAGWNQDRDDWLLFHSLPTAQCFVAGRASEVIGAAVALQVSSRVGWISMVLVDSLHRRQGVGRVLMHAAIEHLEEHLPTIMLDATPAGAALYQTLGFVRASSVTRMRRTRAIPSMPVDDRPKVHEVVIEPSVIDRVGDVDEKWASYYRSALWQGLSTRHGARLFFAGESDAGIDGYALMRPGHSATQVGPIAAPAEAIARSLLTHICSCATEALIIDIPETSHTLSGLIADLGFRPERDFIRMRRGAPAQIGPRDWATAGPDWG